MIGLTLDSISGILPTLKKEKYEEPLPTMDECDKSKLISSLKTPFQRPLIKNNIDNYCDKSALLFCLMIENHSFINGNKRIAVAALVTLGLLNGYEYRMSEITLYSLAMAVTLLSKYHLFNEAVEEVKTMLKDTITPATNPLPVELVLQSKSEFEEFLFKRE